MGCAEKSRQLIEAERLAAVGETVAGLSHTIKNIAGGLDGGMFVLQKGIDLQEADYLHQGWDLVRSNVDRIKTLSLDVGIPAGLTELGVKETDLRIMAENAQKDACGLTNPRCPSLDDVVQIYRNAL